MESLSGMHRVVGFDPGLNITGYGVVECRGATVRLIEAGTVRSKGETLEERLLTIHGVICLAGVQAGLAVHHYLPNRVKSTLTGSGHAGKEQIQSAVQRELGLATKPKPADAADALAVALTDYHLRLRPLLFGTAIVRIRSSRA